MDMIRASEGDTNVQLNTLVVNTNDCKWSHVVNALCLGKANVLDAVLCVTGGEILAWQGPVWVPGVALPHAAGRPHPRPLDNRWQETLTAARPYYAGTVLLT